MGYEITGCVLRGRVMRGCVVYKLLPVISDQCGHTEHRKKDVENLQ